MRFTLISTLLVCTAAALHADPIVADGAKLEQVTTGYGLADGPAWDGKGALYFPDVRGGNIHRYFPATGKVEIFKEEAGRISALMFDSRGRLHAVDNGNQRILRFDGDTPTVLAAEAEAKPPNAPNDLCVDRNGGVYYTLTRMGVVRYITPRGKLTTAVAEIPSANGLTLSPDEKTLYVASHAQKQIWAYDVTGEGSTSNARLFATLGDTEGSGADGMTIDHLGNVYCAGQTDIWVFDPTGKLLTKIAVPEKPLVNCAFGDADRQTLYITAGTSVYRIRTSVRGIR